MYHQNYYFKIEMTKQMITRLSSIAVTTSEKINVVKYDMKYSIYFAFYSKFSIIYQTIQF